MKAKLSQSRYMLQILKNCQNFIVTAHVCKHTRVFQGFWETLKESRNVEYIIKPLLFGELKL